MFRALLLGTLIPFLAAITLSRPATGDQPQTVAGQTLESLTPQLSDSDRVIRLRAAHSLGSLAHLNKETGSENATFTQVMIDALDHDDAAVQYIIAEQLGLIGGEALQKAKPKLEKLVTAKESLGSQMAASFALCRAGDPAVHLPLLIDALEHPERGVVCSAAALIGKIGPNAKDAIPALEAVVEKHRAGVKGGDYHRGGAAMNALRKIRATEEGSDIAR